MLYNAQMCLYCLNGDGYLCKGGKSVKMFFVYLLVGVYPDPKDKDLLLRIYTISLFRSMKFFYMQVKRKMRRACSKKEITT